jgi:hypothetical protein
MDIHHRNGMPKEAFDDMMFTPIESGSATVRHTGQESIDNEKVNLCGLAK